LLSFHPSGTPFPELFAQPDKTWFAGNLRKGEP
jgi:hypothetical protein